MTKPFELEPYDFLAMHGETTRRYFLGLGAAGAAAWALHPLAVGGAERAPQLAEAISKLEPYFNEQDKFRDVSRGKPVPHQLPDEEKQKVGLTRETWKLEVVADEDAKNKPDIRNPLTIENGNALDFAGLMKLAEKHSVRFPKVMTCNNIGRPVGTGIWEGVPLREVLWLTRMRRNVRRVFYHGFHNDQPAQMFRGSLPIGRVLEDPFGLPPVILAYKLNGDWLTSKRGGPVRIVAPEAYGFKSVKWLQHVTITNLYHANDTYAKGNNDVDSWLKTFAATLLAPTNMKPDTPFAVTGYAQVGVSGCRKVQVCIHNDADELPVGDPYFTKANWMDAEIMPPPADWGGKLPGDSIPSDTMGFDDDGAPEQWPMRLSKLHWAKLMPGLPPGEYHFRCRTIDENGNAQPMPRPFDKSGRTSIESVAFVVK
ncbi:MAG: molybdopterin-dependent oxidoreductase [Pirellulaceae bacterium]|jgi:hypothetical protein|nr:molybdopterin-dependent oxidoreductase [Pirellulaceae bacterium]